MKCEYCPALKCEGYEYPETSCSVGADEEYGTDDGCTLHHATIRKRVRENEEAELKMYQDIGEYYKESDINERLGINVSDPEGKYVKEAMHCIGLDHKKPYTRNGKRFYKPYRNYFNTKRVEDGVWDILTKVGHAEETSEEYFSLTAEGFRWLGRVLQITIKEEESERRSFYRKAEK